MKSLWKWLIILVLILLEFLVWTYPYEEGIRPFSWSPWADKPGIINQEPEDPAETLEPEPQQPAVEEPEPAEPSNPEPTNPAGQPQTNDASGYSENPKPAEDGGLMILVNKEYYLSRDYIPDDLAPIRYYATDRSPEGRYMRKEAADQFNRMAEAAAADGFEIVMTTAYRSYGFQSTLYNNYVKAHGQKEADRFSARPGHSEHQTGLAVDISAPSVGYALTQDFEGTPEWEWLMEHGREYGFILRYPKGKTQITGYMYEPWHFRYVGLEAAKEIEESAITLEEYLHRSSRS